MPCHQGVNQFKMLKFGINKWRERENNILSSDKTENKWLILSFINAEKQQPQSIAFNVRIIWLAIICM